MDIWTWIQEQFAKNGAASVSACIATVSAIFAATALKISHSSRNIARKSLEFNQEKESVAGKIERVWLSKCWNEKLRILEMAVNVASGPSKIGVKNVTISYQFTTLSLLGASRRVTWICSLQDDSSLYALGPSLSRPIRLDARDTITWRIPAIPWERDQDPLIRVGVYASASTVDDKVTSSEAWLSVLSLTPDHQRAFKANPRSRLHLYGMQRRDQLREPALTGGSNYPNPEASERAVRAWLVQHAANYEARKRQYEAEQEKDAGV